jgi:hypothetical protein
LDPCNGRTRLLFAKVLQASSRSATAKQQITLAHELKDYSQIYRIGHDLLLPTALSADKVKLL